jgi:hypothetical protein
VLNQQQRNHAPGGTRECLNRHLPESLKIKPALREGVLGETSMLVHAGRLIILVAVLTVTAPAAELCAENVLLGSYGFQLSGETMISVPPAAVAGMARIVFCRRGKT